MDSGPKKHRVVIVGGGAGGLELATRLGNGLGKKKKAEIILVDPKLTHLWKPLLHEVAAGTLNASGEELEYLAHAHAHHFEFQLGRVTGLDRSGGSITLAPIVDSAGSEVVPGRRVSYDTLVIAIGSVTNSFGVDGVDEHCMFLDSRSSAESFQELLIRNHLRAHSRAEPIREGQLHVAIVGAGATGVELAAELRKATRQLVAYGLDRIDPERDVKLSLIEAGTQVLPALPEKLTDAVLNELDRLGIAVYTGEAVSKVTADGLYTSSGRFIPAAMKVWAAGIRADDVLRTLDGLETNDAGQLVVTPTLQTTLDESIFAFGDCASCAQPGSDEPVPPRAQAAHQQASLLSKSVARRIQGQPLREYIYKDYGSLVSLSGAYSIGTLMGNLTGDVMISGRLARWVYVSLYRTHLLALHGVVRTALLIVTQWLMGTTRPSLKLH